MYYIVLLSKKYVIFNKKNIKKNKNMSNLHNKGVGAVKHSGAFKFSLSHSKALLFLL